MVAQKPADSFQRQEARLAPADTLRASTVVLAGLALLLTAFTLWWAGSGTLLADFGGDNAVYFLTASHYSPYGAARVGGDTWRSVNRSPVVTVTPSRNKM